MMQQLKHAYMEYTYQQHDFRALESISFCYSYFKNLGNELRSIDVEEQVRYLHSQRMKVVAVIYMIVLHTSSLVTSNVSTFMGSSFILVAMANAALS